MASTLRSFANTNARLKPTVGDYKTNALETDHMGWLKCDGRELNISDYAELYRVISDNFGGVSGSTFRLPAPQGRVPGFVGRPETNGVLDPSTNVHDLGETFGEEIHLLLLSEIPAHNHNFGVSGETTFANGSTSINGNHNHGGVTDTAGLSISSVAGGGSGGNVADDAGTHSHSIAYDGSHNHVIASNGGSQPHNNIQPTIWLGNLFIYSGRPWVATPNARALIGAAPVPGSNNYPPETSLSLY